MSSAAQSSPHLFSIGQVRAQLREEFPDLTHSKLHFLESEGLIAPVRTASGYRKYTDADIDRIVFILRAQRDRFWPLKMIKAHLESADDHEGPVHGLAAHALGRPEAAPVRLTRIELAREARVAPAFITELEEYGLLPHGADIYGPRDLDIVIACRDLARTGLQPRHLALVRSTAQRQAHLLRSVTTAAVKPDDPAAAEQAADAERFGARALQSLHAALLSAELDHPQQQNR